LCTVVPLSTTPPRPVCPFHYRLETDPTLPSPYDSPYHWVKGDMVYTLSFRRLSLMHRGKDANGVRIYDDRVVSAADLECILRAMAHGIGLGHLTKNG